MTTIERVTITPVAFRDPPLLNAVGVHEPFALRSIIQLHTNDGLVVWASPTVTAPTSNACA